MSDEYGAGSTTFVEFLFKNSLTRIDVLEGTSSWCKIRELEGGKPEWYNCCFFKIWFNFIFPNPQTTAVILHVT